MPDVIRIKRRTSGAAGAPTSLANAELAYNEVGDVLYYGKGNDGTGVATSIVAVGGSGAFQPLDADLTAIAALTGTNVIYYRSAANTWATVTIGTGLTFIGGTLSATGGGGTGNVSNVGTPTNGQLAQWTDTTHIQGVAASSLGFAPLASPVFTGDPRSVTPATADNDTSIATTAFVKAQGYEIAANKGVANGYASLDATTKVPAAQLPSYVDDVVEYANLAAFPVTGTAGLIYVALDTNKIYRWSGSVYVEISPSPGSTDAVPEGSVNLYYTDARVAANATVVSKAPLVSPVFTGDPRAPTPTAGDNDTSIATTAFVTSAISTAGGSYQPLDADLTSLAGASATGAIYYRSAANTWGPITIGGNLTFAGGTLNATVGTSDLASYAPLASPTFTGDPKAPTPATADNDTSIATTAFVQANLANYQPFDADLTAIAALTGTNVIYYRSATNTWAAVTIGAGLTFTGGTLTASAGGGNVSNVGTPANNQLAVWTAATTIKGDANFTWDGSTHLIGAPGRNGIRITTLATGNSQGLLDAFGIDANISLGFSSKGVNPINLATNGYGNYQVAINHQTVAGLINLQGGDGNNNIQLTGGASGNKLGILNVNLTGAPTAVTPASTSNDTSVATTAFVKNAAITNIVIQKFTASGTYTPTAGMKFCIIECFAAGAGGGGTNNSVSGQSWAGGGGGAGGYSRAVKTAAQIGASATVTIGAAGSGAVAGGAATAGGDTSVGAHCIAKGGSPGVSQTGSANAPGGAGGIAGTGDVTGTGQAGQPGLLAAITLSSHGGAGGSTMLGSGGPMTMTAGAVNGASATGYGAGGAGAGSFGGNGSANGGNGSPGFTNITEYI